MYIVGLTGGIGSGKTTIAYFFSERDIKVINADQLARKVVQPGTIALSQIKQKFGDKILTESYGLNRSLLREIVFKDERQRVWLENLLHPLIEDEINKSIESALSQYVVLESPLLLETNQHKLVNRILVIDVSPEIQLKRTLSRDGGSEATIKAIINSQLTRLQRLNMADDVINNEQDLKSVRIELESLHQNYLSMAVEN
ncbi:MAG: dephospho-CoA kinase [Gammaproteobacteria bacterium]|nr:dephospho-CoA kinase [Gammaproteobacteria bacterium]|tara:strand:- start:536 stop:1135 length:600 start_codon:yes stop_codon:yes gene_type:complete